MRVVNSQIGKLGVFFFSFCLGFEGKLRYSLKFALIIGLQEGLSRM